MALIVSLAIAPTMAAKVYIDYDHEADFSKYHKFKYKESAETDSDNPLMHDRVVEMIKERLVAAGFEEVDSDPDMYVIYHVTTENQHRDIPRSFGVGYGGGWGWVTTETTYVEVTLLIDAWDAGTQKLVWRGGSVQIFKGKPDKLIAQIEKALDKIAKKWGQVKAKSL
jgi:hypothetical protein